MFNTPLIELNMCIYKKSKTNNVIHIGKLLMHRMLDIVQSLQEMFSAPGKTILMLFLYFLIIKNLYVKL